LAQFNQKNLGAELGKVITGIRKVSRIGLTKRSRKTKLK
jgi:hypothetical protein